MAFQIETSIHINAPREKVWEILTDFDAYPEWNPFIQKISMPDDSLKVGNKLSAYIKAPKSSGMTFKPTLVAHEAQISFAWLGHLFISGLFDGRHSFELKTNKEGGTTFIHSEQFSGMLVPLFKSSMPKFKRGFESMNEALKIKAEK
ncbi:MAG: hypothetical protein ACI959_000100 [Limisphaerales bacterium]|jgi:hypothetical protein